VTRYGAARLWLIEHIPDGVLFHPAEWLFALLCFVTGIRVVATGAESQSLESVLPGPLYGAWGGVLVVGSVALASGLASIRRVEHDRYVVTRIPAYRLGLRLLAISTLIYSGALVAFAGSAGLTAAVFPVAFAGMCGARLLMLGGR